MVGIIESSQNSIQTFKKILLLKESIDSKLLTFGRKAQLAKTLINHLYTTPICHSQQFETWLSVTAPTANALIKDLQKADLLKEITGFKRNRLFAFNPYLRIFD
jgi:Fic family protein